MRRIWMAALLLSISAHSAVLTSGCGVVKDKNAITPDRKTQFGTYGQAMPASARKGIAEMMAKHNNNTSPPPPEKQP